MRLLWVATKPPWPPVDGGRRVLAETVACLRAAGHEVRVVAPGPGTAGATEGLTVVPASPRPWPGAVARALWRGWPVTVARHQLPAVRRAVAEALARDPWDAVVAEQLQALAQCQAALEAGLPLVLRAQNVESDLWAAAARSGGLAGPALSFEARRLARHEAAALERVSAVAALTTEDAARLRELAPAARVRVLPAPFPAELPAAEAPLPGQPALVILAGGWRPNREGALWFVAQAWPLVRARHPGARLHVYGADLRGDGVTCHAAPADSRPAFAPGSLQVVPLRIASGVRVKILEAWARGVPVVATPRGAAGLAAEDGRQLLLAEDAPGLARAVSRLVEEPGLAARLVTGGRALLTNRHAPGTVARAWEDLLADVRTSG